MAAQPGLNRRSRDFPRVDLELPVEFSYAGKTYQDRITTLGGGGLFLTSTGVIMLGNEIEVRFRPGKRLSLIQARVKALYQIPQKGTGFQFTQIGPQHRQVILRLIRRKLTERRKDPRAPLAIQITSDESMVLGFSRDVSGGGMYVETPKPLPSRSTVSLRFHLEDGGSLVVAQGVVAYQVERLGMGIRFTEIQRKDRGRIEAYVSKWAGAADSTKARTSSRDKSPLHHLLGRSKSRRAGYRND